MTPYDYGEWTVLEEGRFISILGRPSKWVKSRQRVQGHSQYPDKKVFWIMYKLHGKTVAQGSTHDNNLYETARDASIEFNHISYK